LAKKKKYLSEVTYRRSTHASCDLGTNLSTSTSTAELISRSLIASVDSSFRSIDPVVLAKIAALSGKIDTYSKLVGLSSLAIAAPVARESDRLLHNHEITILWDLAKVVLKSLGFYDASGLTNT
jgi:hypothetical protein